MLVNGIVIASVLTLASLGQPTLQCENLDAATCEFYTSMCFVKDGSCTPRCNQASTQDQCAEQPFADYCVTALNPPCRVQCSQIDRSSCNNHPRCHWNGTLCVANCYDFSETECPLAKAEDNCMQTWNYCTENCATSTRDTACQQSWACYWNTDNNQCQSLCSSFYSPCPDGCLSHSNAPAIFPFPPHPPQCTTDCSALTEVDCLNSTFDCFWTTAHICTQACDTKGVADCGTGIVPDNCVAINNQCFPDCRSILTAPVCNSQWRCNWNPDTDACQFKCTAIEGASCPTLANLGAQTNCMVSGTSCVENCTAFGDQVTCPTSSCRWDSDVNTCDYDCQQYMPPCPGTCVNPSLWSPTYSCEYSCEVLVTEAECNQGAASCIWRNNKCATRCTSELTEQSCRNNPTCVFEEGVCATNCSQITDPIDCDTQYCAWSGTTCSRNCYRYNVSTCPVSTDECGIVSGTCTFSCGAYHDDVSCVSLPSCMWDATVSKCSYACGYFTGSCPPNCFPSAISTGPCLFNCSAIQTSDVCSNGMGQYCYWDGRKCLNQCSSASLQGTCSIPPFASHCLTIPSDCTTDCSTIPEQVACTNDYTCLWNSSNCLLRCSSFNFYQCPTESCVVSNYECIQDCADWRQELDCQFNNHCQWNNGAKTCSFQCSSFDASTCPDACVTTSSGCQSRCSNFDDNSIDCESRRECQYRNSKCSTVCSRLDAATCQAPQLQDECELVEGACIAKCSQFTTRSQCRTSPLCSWTGYKCLSPNDVVDTPAPPTEEPHGHDGDGHNNNDNTTLYVVIGVLGAVVALSVLTVVMLLRVIKTIKRTNLEREPSFTGIPHPHPSPVREMAMVGTPSPQRTAYGTENLPQMIYTGVPIPPQQIVSRADINNPLGTPDRSSGNTDQPPPQVPVTADGMTFFEVVKPPPTGTK